MRPRSMIEICCERVRTRPLLELHAHEVGRLAEELAKSDYDMMKHRYRTPGEIEEEMRSGHATFYGAPVRCL